MIFWRKCIGLLKLTPDAVNVTGLPNPGNPVLFAWVLITIVEILSVDYRNRRPAFLLCGAHDPGRSNVRPEQASNCFLSTPGSTVIIISGVGDAVASTKWPPRTVPSSSPTIV